MISIISSLSISFTLIQVPFDNFCNQPGSRHAPRLIREELLKNTNINLNSEELVECQDFPTVVFDKVFDMCKTAQEKNDIPIIIGGDHSCAIPSVFSSQSTCVEKNMTLGVLWIDAHADFNTMECSESKNIHGMPVAILCHHTMPVLAMGEELKPSQFQYVGVRDIDLMESLRMKQYNMSVCEPDGLVSWLDSVDKVHVSWDVDSIDPGEISSVNTPVGNGLSCDTVKKIFEAVRQSNKLIAIDIVEYNPKGDAQFKDLSTIVDVIDHIF